MRALTELGLSFFAVLAFAAGANAADIHHYVFFNRDRERIADPTGLLIALLEKLGVVWNVVRVSPERQAAKALPTPPKTGGVTA